MTVAAFVFSAFAISTTPGGLSTVISPNPVHSVLWLILAFLSSAGLFVLQARKGGRAAFHLAPPFIMHAGDKHLKDGEDYGPEARDILRFGAAFPLRD